MIGILGGMGTQAGLDFCNKLAMINRGKIDQEYFLKGINQITETVERVSKIIKGLKTFSRDSKSDDKESHAISEVIEKAADLCREKFKINNVKLIINTTVKVEVLCSDVQILQVISNFINNSFDAIIETVNPWVKIETEACGDEVVISVTDSGDGIPEEVVEQMMNPFFTTKDV